MFWTVGTPTPAIFFTRPGRCAQQLQWLLSLTPRLSAQALKHLSHIDQNFSSSSGAQSEIWCPTKIRRGTQQFHKISAGGMRSLGVRKLYFQLHVPTVFQAGEWIFPATVCCLICPPPKSLAHSISHTTHPLSLNANACEVLSGAPKIQQPASSRSIL